jgi:hypothetical protein
MKKNEFANQIEKDIKKAKRQLKENPFGAVGVGIGDKDLGNEKFPSLHKAKLWVQKQAKTQNDFVWGMACTLDPQKEHLAIKNQMYFSKKTGWTESFENVIRK